MDISELQQKIINFRNERDWQQFHNPKDLAVSLSLEASEVLEHFQWKNFEEVDIYVNSHREEIAEEMADVLWYLMSMADTIEIDLEKALLNKLAKNVARYSVEKAKGNHKKYTELDE